MPISDIKTILGPLTDKYFHKDADLNLEAIYTTLFSKEDTFVQEVLENVMKQFHMSADLFPDAPKADQASPGIYIYLYAESGHLSQETAH